MYGNCEISITKTPAATVIETTGFVHEGTSSGWHFQLANLSPNLKQQLNL